MNADDTMLVLATAPALAYREYLYRPGGRFSHWIDAHYEVVARPGVRMDRAPRQGDVFIEVALGRMDSGRCVTLRDGELAVIGSRSRLAHGQLLLRPRRREPSAEPMSILAFDHTGDAEDTSTLAAHVKAARALWTKLFGQDPVLGKVMILDMANVPSTPVGKAGYHAWTNSATRIYLASAAAKDALTLEVTLRHEAVHVLQFVKLGGPPKSYEQMVKHEIEAYQQQLERLQKMSADPAQRKARSKAQNDRLAELLDISKHQLGEFNGAATQTDANYRNFLLKREFLPPHQQLRDLYDPPAGSRNPAAQESVAADGGALMVDADLLAEAAGTKLPSRLGAALPQAWEALAPIAPRNPAACAGGKLTSRGTLLFVHDAETEMDLRDYGGYTNADNWMLVHTVSDVVEGLRAFVGTCGYVTGIHIEAHGGWANTGGFRMGNDTDGDGHVESGEAQDFVSTAAQATKFGTIIRNAFGPGGRSFVSIAACSSSGPGNAFISALHAASGTITIGSIDSCRSGGSWFSGAWWEAEKGRSQVNVDGTVKVDTRDEGTGIWRPF